MSPLSNPAVISASMLKDKDRAKDNDKGKTTEGQGAKREELPFEMIGVFQRPPDENQTDAWWTDAKHKKASGVQSVFPFSARIPLVYYQYYLDTQTHTHRARETERERDRARLRETERDRGR